MMLRDRGLRLGTGERLTLRLFERDLLREPEGDLKGRGREKERNKKERDVLTQRLSKLKKYL